MLDLGYMVIVRAVDDRPLATTGAELRALAEAVLEIGADHGVFTFGAADSHLHVGLACDRRSAGRFAQRLLCALRVRLGLEMAFEVARIRPFRDQWHRASNLTYMIRQAAKHGVATDPWLEATALPDLLGLRPRGATLRATALRVFPRLKTDELLPLLGRAELAEADSLPALADATRAAALLPSLTGRSARVVEARRAAVAATRARSADVAAALAIPARTVQHLRTQPADHALVRAIRLQMGLRSAVAEVARDGASPSYVAADA